MFFHVTTRSRKVLNVASIVGSAKRRTRGYYTSPMPLMDEKLIFKSGF